MPRLRILVASTILLGLLGLAVVLAANLAAQQAKLPRIGVIFMTDQAQYSTHCAKVWWKLVMLSVATSPSRGALLTEIWIAYPRSPPT